MFPFSISYSVQLTRNITLDEYESVLKYVKEFIEKKTADDIIIWENGLEFKSRLLKWRSRNNIMSAIDKGEFYILSKEGKTFISYKIYMYFLLLSALVFAGLVEALTKNIALSVFVIIFMGGLNWLIAVIRHRYMLNDLKKRIDLLIPSGIYPFYANKK
ncbi:hypothetical protein F1C16_07565 [Hymenobacter sp. NBH84]|uniref:hypothetical protein n=1 Tax=Hymenobacter sp. NBH84 TaxID=2596915 RepID=UPI001624A0DB|nr:hypothetical protein [Hymenobacter sp. NBH84]QNE39421.1 hypothetical protein F1C16_07565 [Hymenobacter sp. NBH84]